MTPKKQRFEPKTIDLHHHITLTSKSERFEPKTMDSHNAISWFQTDMTFLGIAVIRCIAAVIQLARLIKQTSRLFRPSVSYLAERFIILRGKFCRQFHAYLTFPCIYTVVIGATAIGQARAFIKLRYQVNS
jgi:hypothetical protein